MTRGSRWTSVASAGEARFELAPAGFRGFYFKGLGTLLVVGSMVLPMGLLGLIGAVFWDDFSPALRAAMGLVGGAVVVAAVVLPVWLIVDATTLRGRVRVLPGGVFVEVGRVAPTRALWLAPRGEVEVKAAPDAELARGGALLSCRGQTIRVGVGFEPAQLYAMIEAIRAALRTTPVADEGPPASAPLGPPWGARLRTLGADLLRPLRRLTSYSLLDLGSLVGVALLQWVFVDVIDRRAAYPAAFALFLLGLAARRFDGGYITGLRRRLADDSLWGFYYVLAGVALAFAALIGVAGAKIGGLWGLTAGVVAIVLHTSMLRRARGEAPAPRASRAVDLALALTLIPITVLHEASMFQFLASSDDLGPLALTFVVPMVLVAYLPVRLHVFVDEPDDRSNVAWFWVTVGLLALQPLLTIGPAIAREL